MGSELQLGKMRKLWKWLMMTAQQCEYVNGHWPTSLETVQVANFYVMYILLQFFKKEKKLASLVAQW